MVSQRTDDAVRAAEQRRCELLVAGAADELEWMLADDLVHIHLNGRADDKAGYMSSFREKYRFADVRRGPLNVRIWNNTAVMVGPLSQKITIRETGKEVSGVLSPPFSVGRDGRV